MEALRKPKAKILMIILGFICLCFISYKWLPSYSNTVTSDAWDGVTVSTTFLVGNGSEENPYIIQNGADLAYLKSLLEGDLASTYADKYYRLSNNINLGDHEFMIYNQVPFTGIIDGDAHIIQNGIIINSLFQSLHQATIKNINFQNITIKNKESDMVSFFAVDSTENTFQNISVQSTFQVSSETIVNGLFDQDKKSTLENLFIDFTYLTPEGEDTIVTKNWFPSTYDESVLKKVFVKDTSMIEKLDRIDTKEMYIYHLDQNKMTINGSDMKDYLSQLNISDLYYFTQVESLIQLQKKEVGNVTSTTSVAPLANIPSFAFELHESGVDSSTLYVNNLEQDWNYYQGLNYTSSSSGSLPSGKNQNLYNESNLVRVQVAYSSEETMANKILTGTYSLEENISKVVYYDYYPVVNNTITIELIDNPFVNRPTNKGFNNWVSDGNLGTVRFDKETYKRYIDIPVTFQDGKPVDLSISFHASWVDAQTAEVSANNSWSSIFENFNDSGLKKLELSKKVCDPFDMTGYFYQQSASFAQSYSGYNDRGQTVDTTCWSLRGCTYYTRIENEYFVDGNTYYELKNGSMSQVDNSQLPIHCEVFTSEEYKNKSMAGYYTPVNLSYGDRVTGYYDNTGNYLSSGTCQSNQCTYYKLLQSYENNQEPIYDENQEYYYMVTRDTNIAYLTASRSDAWGSSQNKPFTLTSLYNGIDYRNQATLTTSSDSFTAYNDITLEYLTLNARTTGSNSDPTSSSSGRGYFYGNFHNAKLGRGIKQDGNNRSFNGVSGGNASSSGSTNSYTKYTLQVESGYYNTIVLSHPSDGWFGNDRLYLNMHAVYGNDLDRITNKNNLLDVYYCASGSWGGTIYSQNESLPALNLIVKSGTFGSGKYDYSTGIYVGGRGGGDHYTARTIKVEGGSIYNLIGGPLTASSREDLNDTFMYMTGGEVDMITGGAGRTATYGHRIISLTGGTVNYSVFGGSNGYQGSNGDGTVNGTSLIYVGGTSQVGSSDHVRNGDTLFGAEAGSVFGIGNGRSGSTSIGSNDNSMIVIDGESHILNNVYGGGNYGATGISSNKDQTTSTIDIINGTIDGDVYGGGNRNGSGSSSKNATITITMYDGTVQGSVYGGSNESGTIYGSTKLTIYGGTVGNNIYGGGRGGMNDSSDGTFVSKDVSLTVGTIDQGPTIEGSVYGGSAYGSVNGTSNTTTASSSKVDITIQNGIIKQSVFGGGQGSDQYTPYVMGPILVTINNGNIKSVYGGNDQAGIPNSTVQVRLNGGTVESSYGGGNKSSVKNTDIILDGATTTNLFGGSNERGDVESTSVVVKSGTVSYLYGGNNIGGTVDTTNVIIEGGIVQNEAYGGGNEVATVNTNLTVTNVQQEIPYVFGSGKSADVTNANVVVNGDTVKIGSLFGGSNKQGQVNTVDLQIKKGQITNAYGGNNEGGQTQDVLMSLSGGILENVYGGGNKASTSTSKIQIENTNIQNVYGGGNEAGIDSADIQMNSGTIGTVYGGSNQSGTAHKTTIQSNTDQVSVTTIYGGNNAGGTTEEPLIHISNGTIGTIFGGGNLAPTTKANIMVEMGTIETIYGGGNEAPIYEDTILTVKEATVSGNIYGGGNNGVVEKNTSVDIQDATVLGSIYAGGNGVTATVKGNTNVTVSGKTTVGSESSKPPHYGSVFGGGNAASTGIDGIDSSLATVNIVGGTIYGNVYGGANTSVVYGKTDVNIGLKTLPEELQNMTPSAIYIRGTIFGGGEANAEGDENYDYSFISVTKGIEVDINGEGHDQLESHGSIFGSGNASSTKGESHITIKNYGTMDSPQRNISIQRTNLLTIDHSYIALSGTTDRTNEYSDVLFALSIIDHLKLQNNSSLFLENGTNLLRKFESLDQDGNYEEVNIDPETKEVTQNVDNRIYLLEGQKMNIATNESVTSYGEVYGMTFLGMFTYNRDQSINMGIYDPKYKQGDPLNWGDMPNDGSYVLALHKTNHDITKDGFYSNFMDEETSTNHVNYIDPTPEDSSFYMWVIGEAVLTYDIDLVASKYSTLGTVELPFLEFAKPNTTFQVLGIDTSGLNKEISLVSKDDIPRVAQTGAQADQVMGLSIQTTNNGWLTNGETQFLTEEPYVLGDTSYVGDNSTTIPSLLFYLYHSKNITTEGEMGNVKINLMAITKIDDLTNETKRLVINVDLSRALYQTNEYEGAMTSGRKYEMFTSTVVDITSKSSLSAYFSLYEDSGNLYKEGYHHTLVSSYVLPVNTKLTMIDIIYDKPTYYYHTITEEDVANATLEYQRYGEVSYDLSMFTKMGSVNSKDYYNDELMNQKYYSEETNTSSEEFIFIVDFGDTDIQNDQLNNSLLFELRDKNEQTLISVLGIQHQSLTYDIYTNKDAVIDLSGTIDQNVLYVGHHTDLEITTNFLSEKVGSDTIYDTKYFDSKLGLKITLLDENQKVVSGATLMGMYFELNGQKYYPGMDGSTRIKLSDRVGNTTNKIQLNLTNASLASGNYTIRLDSFGSSDGIYHGLDISDTITIPVQVINSVYGLDLISEESSVIIYHTTGKNQQDTNTLDFVLKYHSGLANPSIRMTLYRRKYEDVYDTDYEKVDLQDYVDQPLTPTNNPLEYLVISKPQETNKLSLITKENLLTGTYRLDFGLYDGDILIGTVSRYVIIK